MSLFRVYFHVSFSRDCLMISTTLQPSIDNAQCIAFLSESKLISLITSMIDGAHCCGHTRKITNVSLIDISILLCYVLHFKVPCRGKVRNRSTLEILLT